MKSTLTLFRRSAVVLTAVAVCTAVGSATAMAQTEHCANLYSRVMATYQETGGYGSAHYADQLARYTNQCLSAGPLRPYAYRTRYQPQAQPYVSPVVQGYAPGGWEQSREQRREWDRDQH